MTSNIKIKKINNKVSSIIIDEPKTYNSLSFKNLSDHIKDLNPQTINEETQKISATKIRAKMREEGKIK